MGERVYILCKNSLFPKVMMRRGIIDKLEIRKMQNRNFLKSSSSYVHRLKYSTKPRVNNLTADTIKSMTSGDLGQKN